MMQSANIENIVIVGGGTAGWMVAAAMANRLPKRLCNITLIESDAIGTVGVGESTIPHIRQFNQTLGIDEATFLKETHATVKLGIQFNDWGAIGESYFHPFGEHGQITQGIDFHQYWLKARALGENHPIEDYSIAATAALARKFPLSTQDKQTKFADYTYSYHIDATAYARFLRQYSQTRGVSRVEGKVASVKQHNNQFIQSVTLESGEEIAGDLFIDCTGFRALLIEKVLDVPFIDWSHWLPTDTAVAVQCDLDRTNTTKPYTQATARASGWQWQIPLQHRIGNGHVFTSAYTKQQDAMDVLMNSLPGKAIAEPKVLRFKAGRRQESWQKNCVAIGLSSGFLEPLESTSIYLIQQGISKLLELFPDKQCNQTVINEYNQCLGQSYELIRNFIILHYHATKRHDSDFWLYCQNMSIPEELERLISLFSESGRADLGQFGVWPAVCIGQNIMPKYYDTRLDNMTEATLKQFMAGHRRNIQDMVASFPNATDYINEQLAKGLV
ncbi:tryptophan 7-halogenase [Paraglaciecola aquimarina]|uniref:Tryptophan 7-halogenase n=1 Tax=Paraglaciecola algarum TaxID=3050085 RepID=A0ABS9D9C1_9ALTE|nr:tryptophan halogenase family protein [Paraglaciecola sp. G1-23]MCF2949561.1 tryptophan 7-halogenase [Paraglaciecola sp. G1-23]